MSAVEVANRIAQTALSNMMRGLPARLSRTVVRGRGMMLKLEPANYMKVMKAKSAGKGVVIKLTDMERDYNGEGLKEIWEGLKKGAKFVKEKIIDTPFYQSTIRPIVRKAIDAGISLVPNATAQDVLKQGRDYASEKWGAFGMMDKPIYGGGALPIQTADPNQRYTSSSAFVSTPPEVTSSITTGSGYIPISRNRGGRKGGYRGGSFLMP